MKDNVKAVVSSGGTCFVCETQTSNGEYVLKITFNVNVKDPIFGASLGKVGMTEEMHIRCAKELKALLGQRIDQAVSKGGK